MDETVRYVSRACLAWERLRLVYNLVLLVVGLACSWRLRDTHLFLLGGYWGGVVLFGTIANVFYCLGPLLETYACALCGREMDRQRYLLFAAGLFLSMRVVVILTGGRS